MKAHIITRIPFQRAMELTSGQQSRVENTSGGFELGEGGQSSGSIHEYNF